jgi:hypothetical protein
VPVFFFHFLENKFAKSRNFATKRKRLFVSSCGEFWWTFLFFFFFFLAIFFSLNQGRNLQQNILIEKYFWRNDENSPPKISLPGLKHGVHFGAKFRRMAISFFFLKVAKNLMFF